MPTKIDRLSVDWGVESATVGYNLNIEYHPISNIGVLEQFCGSIAMAEVYEHMRDDPELVDMKGLSGERKKLYDRALTFRRLLSASVMKKYAVEVEGSVTEFPLRIESFVVNPDEGIVRVRLGPAETSLTGPDVNETLKTNELPTGLRRLMASITTTAERMAWEDFRRQLAMEPRPAHSETGPQVFVSYREPHARFAESLALRLGEEGLVPWLDKWDILAGDSLPGRIEEGLRRSIAFIPVITADYQSGAWATEELQSAIAKRTETDFKIIPVLLEHCERPELLRHLRYVDFTSQDPESFETRVAEIIDGIYGLTVNPFRQTVP